MNGHATCTGCGQPIVPVDAPVTVGRPWGDNPDWTHADGTPLCRVGTLPR